MTKPRFTSAELLGRAMDKGQPKASAAPMHESKTPSASKAASVQPRDSRAASIGSSHDPDTKKLTIVIPTDVYNAMQLYRLANGDKTGERSLKTIAINAIEAYVGDCIDRAQRL